jgi:Tetratricopeptide repeat
MAGRCGRWLTPALCLAVLTALPARAQTSSDDLARKHFESGVAYLQESDYDSALKAFEKSYELSKRPEILLNLATVHERRGDLANAISSLKRYLEAVPESDQAATVKNRITNLEKRLETQPKPAAPGTASPAPAATPSQPTPSSTAPAAAPAEAPAEQTQSRIPAYIALSIGGAAAVGAVLTGVLAQSEYNDAKDSCSPGCTDDEVSTGKSMALTSTVLTGVAVVGVGIGAALLFTGGSKSEAPPASSRLPRFVVGIGPRAASAQASWSF